MEKKIRKDGEKTIETYEIKSADDLIKNKDARLAMEAELIRLRIQTGRRFR